MKTTFLSLSLLLLIATLSAQNESDALRYTQSNIFGTARYSAMGGAFAALGADFSCLSSNPAGIAAFRKSEISLSPAIYHKSIQSTFNNSSNSDNRYNVNLGNIGLVMIFNTHQNADKENRWISWNLGLGYNRINDFNQRLHSAGPNSLGSSLSHIFVQAANGRTWQQLDDFAEGLAFNTYVIDSTKGNNTKYFSKVPSSIQQKKSVFNSGNMGETVFSAGGNYANKLFVGATIGIQNINYGENSTYSELAQKTDSSTTFKSFDFTQHFSTTGTGINIKIGAIYRVNEWLRFGAAFHSPTAFTLRDDYHYSMHSAFKTGSYETESPLGYFNYTIVTAPRIMGSLGFTIAQKAMIGIDIEFIDYRNSRLNSNVDGFVNANEKTQNNFNAANNLSIGGEWFFSGPFALRLGYSIIGNPYQSSVNTNAQRTNWSVGVGYRNKGVFIDAAYVLTQYNENSFLYNPDLEPNNAVQNKFSATNFIASFGFKF